MTETVLGRISFDVVPGNAGLFLRTGGQHDFVGIFTFQ